MATGKRTDLDAVPSLEDGQDDFGRTERLAPIGDAAPVAARGLERGPDASARYRIVVESGPDKGAEITIAGADRILVGTSPVCVLRVNDPSVSRRHGAFEIAARSDSLRYTDLGSTNGSRIGGIRIVEVLLGGNEVVALGQTSLRVVRAGPAGASSTEVPVATHFAGVVGGSLEMRNLYQSVERLAQSDVPVIIEGETGTGKEKLAESIHERSPRANGPFVVVDCTAIAPTLVEAELFGHERGAFTGAVSMRKGLFEEADGGTLLIDEIGDLDLVLQAKLLRAIERREIRRVGGSKWQKLDVRILAATRRDLDKEVQAGRFRDDLFFRLAVGRVELPPLRKRRGDIPILVAHFWNELGGNLAELPPAFVARLEEYDWPGNVRELQNAVAKRLALGDTPFVPIAAPSTSLARVAGESTDAVAAPGDSVGEILKLALPFARARQQLLADFERRYVEDALARADGVVGEAARVSGLGRRYFQIVRSRSKNE